MNSIKGKKLLVLAGKPIGSCEIVRFAKEHGAYVIVADYLSAEDSAAKRIADEAWDISTAEVDEIVSRAKLAGVDGVYTGVHEFNIKKMIEVCQKLDLPCYTTMEQWEMLDNKRCFKDLCKKYGLPVTKEYKITSIDDPEIDKIEYPVITKPEEGSGSRGFSICNNKSDLVEAFSHASEFSDNGNVLVEQYMDYKNSTIINYTLVDGEVYFSGISEKQSRKVSETGAPIMSVQFYPSQYEAEYLKNLDEKAQNMFKGIGLKNGVIWIEAFCKDGIFTFNEMGFRFGGSLTYYPVEHIYGINQLKLQIEYALTGGNEKIEKPVKLNKDEVYCVFPVHVKKGNIDKICGYDNIMQKDWIKQYVPVHFVGDAIQDWGSAQQVLAYIHFVAKNREEATEKCKWIVNNLHVLGNNREELLFNLYLE